MYRQQFYDAILNDYFNEERSILVTTHEVREIEHILTDVVFIHRGRAVLASPMADIANSFLKLTSDGQGGPSAAPLFSRQTLAGTESIYSGVTRSELEPHGEVAAPNLAELFVAIVEGQA